MYNIDSYSTAGALVGVGIAFVILLLFAVALCIVLYVFLSYSVYTIAKNRNIENPWLAWIPVAQCWIIGQLGDYYLERTGKGKKNLPLIMVILSAAGVVLGRFGGFFGTLGSLVFLALVVLAYIVLYHFYKSVSPNNAVALLVISIIFNVALPFILFANRNKIDEAVFVNAEPVQPQDKYNQ